MIDINTILILGSVINIITISALIYKRKYELAWALAIIEALVIGGYEIWH